MTTRKASTSKQKSRPTDMGEVRKAVIVSLDAELMKQLEEMAQRAGCPLSFILREMVQSFLPNTEDGK